MRSIGLFVIGLFVGGCLEAGARPAAETVPPRAPVVVDVDDLDAQTVALVAIEAGRASVYCGGVWVSRTWILTAGHCVEGNTIGLVNYATRDGFKPGGVFTRMALVRAVDARHDLALLQASPPAHPIARLYLGPLARGARVQTVGHPLGSFWYSYSSGDIAAVREQDLNGTGPMVWIQSTAPISGGNSGGGLFDEEGRLLGIADCIVNEGHDINLFVPGRYAEELIRAQGDGQ